MVFDNIKRKLSGIEFYRIYYKPIGEQTGWSKYSDAYDGMSTPTPQDRFFDIEDPPKNRTYLCVGIKKDGKWAMDVKGTWKKKHGEDESAGESKAELKKRLEKLEKNAGESKLPTGEEIAGIILMDKIQKKMNDGEDIWSVVGDMLNPQSKNNHNPNDIFDTQIKVDGSISPMTYLAMRELPNLPELAKSISSSFMKGAHEEMDKREQQQTPQQPQQEYVEEARTEELDIEVRPKSNTIARILAERAAEKEALERTTVAEEEEEIPSEARAAERFDAVEEEEGATETAPKLDIKEPSEPEEAIEPQTETKKTLIERARERIAAKKKVKVEEAGTKSDIKERIEPETEEMPDVGIEGKGEEGNRAGTEETEEEIARKEMIRKRTEKAMATRARNKAVRERKEVEAEEIEVEA